MDNKKNLGKEVMYRSEIFNLLKESVGDFTEKELQNLEDIFVNDEIDTEELLRKILE
ncbi:MAG: hypothetical protein RL762_396 [Bacteroidota bacterium]|jgi:hypothetical protein